MNEFAKIVFSQITKEYGENIIISGKTISEEKKQIIPVSPAIDSVLGGGIPEGSWVLVSGKPKSGKSTLLLHFASKCQQEEYGSRFIYYLDVENRLKSMNLIGIPNLKTDDNHFKIIRSTEDKILSAQDYLSIGETILRTHPACIVIFDSFSALCHEKELTDGIGTSTRGGGAVLLSQFCRQMSGIVPSKKSIVIGVLHLMANTSGYGAAIIEKGGNAVQYQMDVKLRIKSVEPTLVGNKRVGQKVSWIAECSALGPPGGEADGFIRYGQGIDEITELINFGVDTGLITKAGAWLTLDYMKDKVPEWNDEVKKQYKCQGVEKLYQFLSENKNCFNYLETCMKKMYQ